MLGGVTTDLGWLVEQCVPLWAFLLSAFTEPYTWSNIARKKLETWVGNDGSTDENS
jgi:hypothetical protein